jgi:hypothetical protein
MKETVVALLDLAGRRQRGLIERAAVDLDALRDGLLFGLAEQMDPGLSAARINALRRSVLLDPEKGILKRIEYDEPHRRGEVLVAATMRAFLEIWQRRFAPLGGEGGPLDLDRISEEGAAVAQQLLTAVIRALDYTPPIRTQAAGFARRHGLVEPMGDGARMNVMKPGARAWPLGCPPPGCSRGSTSSTRTCSRTLG